MKFNQQIIKASSKLDNVAIAGLKRWDYKYNLALQIDIARKTKQNLRKRGKPMFVYIIQRGKEWIGQNS